MNVLVTGLNGFVGQEVKRLFEAAGHSVFGVPRQVLMDGGLALDDLVASADVVVNLAGANLFGRWTEEYKRKIMFSRQMATQKIVDAINRVSRDRQPGGGIKLFISASAVGIYKTGSFSDEGTTDTGTGFLADVVRAWEKEAGTFSQARTVILRFGVIVGKNGGVIKKLMPFIRGHLGLVVGEGNQPFPVIHVKDVVGFMLYACAHQEVRGIYNMVITKEVDYKGFVKSLNGISHSWLTVSVPGNFLRLALGESAEVLTQTAHVLPVRLMESGYQLKYPTIDAIVSEVARAL